VVVVVSSHSSSRFVIMAVCLKLRNWVAPDGIQGFWIKRLTSLYSVIVSHFNNMLKDGSLIPHRAKLS